MNYGERGNETQFISVSKNYKDRQKITKNKMK